MAGMDRNSLEGWGMAGLVGNGIDGKVEEWSGMMGNGRIGREGCGMVLRGMEWSGRK
jgi:hypothetical protein